MHPLLNTTRRTLATNESVYPEGAIYDFSRGMWRRPDGAICDDDEQQPRTKKNDLETGEDQKGQ